MSNTVTALLLGDIYGQPGCRAVFVNLKKVIKKYRADFVVINGENAADGFGITPELVDKVFESGADVITSGNHIWQKKDILPVLKARQDVLRPANYPPGVPGKGVCCIEKRGIKFGVINLQGRVRLTDNDCPFRTGKEAAAKLKKETNIIFVDFHAEDAAEKEALAVYLDGKVSTVVGTHTHVQTADERILSKGTGYITDLGMTGPMDSVIGGRDDVSIARSLTQMPLKLEVAENRSVIQGVAVKVDIKSGKTLEIERVWEESLF